MIIIGMEKKFLNEDGSLNVERINKLPLEEYMDVIGDFTEAQSKEYISKITINESNEPIQMVHVDYGLDDERSGIDIEQYLKQRMQNNF